MDEMDSGSNGRKTNYSYKRTCTPPVRHSRRTSEYINDACDSCNNWYDPPTVAPRDKFELKKAFNEGFKRGKNSAYKEMQKYLENQSRCF
jgi:hypothetical protein